MDRDEFENIQPENEKVSIYSKWAIILISVFFGPFVGSILLMLNLRKLGNKSSGFLVLGFGFVYTVIEKIALAKIVGLDIIHPDLQKLSTNRQFFYYSLAMDILGGAILGEFFFKRYIKGSNYSRRSVFPALLIILAISFLLAYVMSSVLPKNSA